MHIIDKSITEFLTLAATGDAPMNEKLLDECLADIRAKIISTFHEKPDNTFRLRMSNIGKDLRQLMLEAKYGRTPASPSFLLKMLTGHIQERILTYICKAQGLKIDTDDVVTVTVDDIDIKGELDWYLPEEGKVYDVKTASDYAYNNKFANYYTLSQDDSFGYIDQLIGYAKGKNAEPGGWVVYNKLTGQYKTVEYPKTLEQSESGWLIRIRKKIQALKSGKMPPCPGVEKETFYKKETGRTIIGKPCLYCDHKQKCHPTAKLLPSKCSQAKDKPMVWYLE
jgi:hypothetical protein